MTDGLALAITSTPLLPLMLSPLLFPMLLPLRLLVLPLLLSMHAPSVLMLVLEPRMSVESSTTARNASRGGWCCVVRGPEGGRAEDAVT